ncbi:MAG: hypothetical protein ABFD89_06960 [Bryobacteraceae bacterium]
MSDDGTIERRIVRPGARLWREGPVELIFGEESLAPSGRYWVAGGIVWPELHETRQEIVGAAVVCGRHIESDVTYVFEEREFCTVDHVLGERGVIAFEGLSSFLNEAWTYYFCKTYYWRQDELTARRHIRQVHRNRMIEPKPVLVELHWRDEKTALDEIFLLDTSSRLTYRVNREVHHAMRKFDAKDGDTEPALRALAAALVGLAKR